MKQKLIFFVNFYHEADMWFCIDTYFPEEVPDSPSVETYTKGQASGMSNVANTVFNTVRVFFRIKNTLC